MDRNQYWPSWPASAVPGLCTSSQCCTRPCTSSQYFTRPCTSSQCCTRTLYLQPVLYQTLYLQPVLYQTLYLQCTLFYSTADPLKITTARGGTFCPWLASDYLTKGPSLSWGARPRHPGGASTPVQHNDTNRAQIVHQYAHRTYGSHFPGGTLFQKLSFFFKV